MSELQEPITIETPFELESAELQNCLHTHSFIGYCQCLGGMQNQPQ